MHLVQTSPPYLITIDRTEWHVGSEPVNVLAAGMLAAGMLAARISLDGKVALPVAWVALPNEGGSSAGEQIQVFDQLLAVVDAGQVDAVVAHREFISVRWLKRLEEEGVPFAVRVRSDRRLQRREDGASLPVRIMARTASPGCSRVLEGVILRGEDSPVTTDVVIQRIGGHEVEDPFVILATQSVEPEVALSRYTERWGIETLFAALKSRGFDLEATRLTAPERVGRLIALLGLAFLWARLVGERRAKTDGPPRELSHGRRQRSIFRYGLDRLQHLLATPEPTRGPLLRCLQLLRSPSAFLSCT